MSRPINYTLSCLIAALQLLLLCACGHPSVPASSTAAGRKPNIKPDYVGVTIPSNICPLNFQVDEPGTEVVARITAPGCSYTYGEGNQVLIDADEWQQLLSAAAGQSLQVEVWMHQADRWTSFDPFTIRVATEEIDPYISYRLIPPSYVSYEEMIIEQRSLTSFETREIYNTRQVITEEKGQCINCHSYQNYGTGHMLFHVRKDFGGTILVDGDRATKVNLKTPQTLSAGVYPAWHPTEPLIAFSTNKTAQIFHPVDTAKIEVFDAESDLILYDVTSNTVTPIATTDSLLECFPTWSPDGRWLYFTSARMPYDLSEGDPEAKAQTHYRDIRYDLCRRSFDPATRQFGPVETLYRASEYQQSVTLPRLSPDGRYVAFSMAPFGCFHVWHPTSDIYALDLSRIGTDSISVAYVKSAPFCQALHAPGSDSYPSFSSNGRWLMFDSRRDDHNFTRPFIAYFGADGVCHKAFELPQQSPAFYTLSVKSFNRPEFMTEPVSVSSAELARVITDLEALPATFVQ